MTDVAQPDAPTEKPDWPPWAKAYLAALEQVPNVSRAAKAAGVDRSTAFRLTQRDEAFAVAAHQAREIALDRLEEVIYASATLGLATTKTVTKKNPDGTVLEVTTTEERHRNPVEGIFFLKRWRPEYRESFRVEQTGAGGGPVKLDVTLAEDVAAAARAELERLGADAAD